MTACPKIALALAALLASTVAAAGQVPTGNSAPQPVPYDNTIPVPQDVMYPGTVELANDGEGARRPGELRRSAVMGQANREKQKQNS